MYMGQTPEGIALFKRYDTRRYINVGPGGQTFRYTSAAMIETPVGVMQGNYHMLSDNGENFKAYIPKFTLSIPRVLH